MNTTPSTSPAAEPDQYKERVVYIRNVFLKYLETLYAFDTGKKQEVQQKELRTIENILLTELKCSFEQT